MWAGKGLRSEENEGETRGREGRKWANIGSITASPAPTPLPLTTNPCYAPANKFS